jgi:hypothetical protein
MKNKKKVYMATGTLAIVTAILTIIKVLKKKPKAFEIVNFSKNLKGKKNS